MASASKLPVSCCCTEFSAVPLVKCLNAAPFNAAPLNAALLNAAPLNVAPLNAAPLAPLGWVDRYASACRYYY